MSISTDLKTTVTYLVAVLGVPLLTVVVLTYINRNSKERLAQRFGPKAIVYVGGLGVVVHELSHLLVALLFGHHINRFRLLITDVPDDGGVLGYVDHSWNRNNYYQFLGNALIGTAPVFGCAAALILLTRWLVPQFYQWGVQELGNLLGLAVPANTTAGPSNWLLVIVWVVLSINITIGGFDLSDADLKSALPAFATLLVVTGLLLFLLVTLGMATAISHYLSLLLTWFILVMALSLAWSLVVNLLVRV